MWIALYYLEVINRGISCPGKGQLLEVPWWVPLEDFSNFNYKTAVLHQPVHFISLASCRLRFTWWIMERVGQSDVTGARPTCAPSCSSSREEGGTSVGFATVWTMVSVPLNALCEGALLKKKIYYASWFRGKQFFSLGSCNLFIISPEGNWVERSLLGTPRPSWLYKLQELHREVVLFLHLKVNWQCRAKGRICSLVPFHRVSAGSKKPLVFTGDKP